jgi:hypothetical protein
LLFKRDGFSLAPAHNGETMPLPNAFQFSQSSLHDFDTCPRRFELRYLRQLNWPAIEAEPVQEAERLARLGQDFHRLVQQHLMGIAQDILEQTLVEADPDLKNWWENYLTHRPAALAEAQIYPELTLTTPLRGYRLTARFDVLAALPDGTFLIVDWKTAHKKPARKFLAGHMQTRVYPYVLAAAGTAFNQGQPIDPAVVKMMYWYPQAPDEPELFEYTEKLFRRDEEFLSELIDHIKNAAKNNHFPLVDSDKPCATCIYRSFCDRGDRPGPLEDTKSVIDDEIDVLALDWDQIAEIQF